MSYNKPQIIAGNMEERESFSCGCPTYSYNGNCGVGASCKTGE